MADPKIVITAEDRTKAAVDSAKAGIKGLQATAASVTGALGALGVTAWAAQMIAGIRSTINEWDELGKAAQRAGFQSAQGMAEFEYAAKLAGVGTAGLETAVGRLTAKMADAAGGTKDAQRLFETLGVKVTDATGNLRGTEEVLTDLAARFANWKDGPEKSALALELFGKSGRDMIPLLNGGERGLQQLREEFRLLRGELSAESNKAAEQFNDNLTRLETSAGKLGRTLAEKLLPVLNTITDKLVDGARKGSLWEGLLEADAEILKRLTGIDLTKQTRDTKAFNDQVERLQALIRSGKGGDQAREALSALLRQRQAAQASPSAYDAYESARMERLASGMKTAAPVVKKEEKALADKISAYQRLNEELERRAKLEAAEAQNGEKLSEAQRYEVEMLAKISSELKELDPAERKRLETRTKEIALSIAVNKSREEERKSRQDALDTAYKNIDALQQEVDRERDALIAIGLTKEQLAELAAGKLDVAAATKEKQAAEEQERDGDLELAKAYSDQAQRLRQLAALKRAVGSRETQFEEERKQVEAFQDIWQSIDRTAQDAFTNIFEGGRDVFRRLTDTLKATLLATLYRMTVQPFVLNIAANLTGTGMGVAQAASGLGGGIGNLAGLAGLGGSLGAFGTAASYGASALFGGTGLTALSGGASMLGAGSVASGLGMMAGVLGPIGIGAALAYSLFGGKGGGPKTEAGFSGGYGDVAQRGDVSGAQQAVASIKAAYAQYAAALGINTDLGNVGFFSAKDPEGTAMTQLQLVSANYNRRQQYGTIENVGRSDQDLQDAIALSTAQLLVTELQKNATGVLGEYLKTVDPTTASLEQLNAALTRVQTAAQQKASIEAQIYDLTTSEEQKLADSRAKELASVDDTNRALLERLYALQDEKKAVEDVTKAESDRAALVKKGLADWQDAYFKSWAAIEKASLTSNAALGSAVDGVNDKFRALLSGIKQQIDEIRGGWLQDGSPSSLQAARQQYDAAVAAVMGGGKGSAEAAARLPMLAQQLLAIAGKQATSWLELRQIQALVAQNLQDSLGPLQANRAQQIRQISGAFGGSSIGVGSSAPSGASRRDGGGMSNDAVVSRLDAILRVQVDIAAHSYEGMKNTREMRNFGVYVKNDPNGTPLVTTT